MVGVGWIREGEAGFSSGRNEPHRLRRRALNGAWPVIAELLNIISSSTYIIPAQVAQKCRDCEQPFPFDCSNSHASSGLNRFLIEQLLSSHVVI